MVNAVREEQRVKLVGVTNEGATKRIVVPSANLQ